MKDQKQSFFDKRGYISRVALRQKLREAPSRSAGSVHGYGRQERTKMEKEIFGSKYGGYISRREYQGRIRKLGMEKYRAKTGKEKKDIGRKIKLLENLRGL